MFDDDETLQMYIEESLDHLEDIESDLLTIEEAGQNVDIDLVNNVFRAAHSIKGGAGFMGLTTIKDLAHHLENVLGLIRNEELLPDSKRISVLLNGFDELETLLRNIESSNEVDVSEQIAALEGVTTDSEPEPESAQKKEQTDAVNFVDIVLPDGRIFPQVSFSDIEQSRSEGKNLFLVEYDLMYDVHQKEKDPLDVLNSLQRTGTLIDARIDVDAVGPLEDMQIPGQIPFQILFATILEDDMTETLFDLEKQYIHFVSQDMIVPAEETDIPPPSGYDAGNRKTSTGFSDDCHTGTS